MDINKLNDEWWKGYCRIILELEELERKRKKNIRELIYSLVVTRRLKALGLTLDDLKTVAYDERADKRPRRLQESTFGAGVPVYNVLVLKDGRRLEMPPIYRDTESVRVLIGIPSTCPSAEARRIVDAYRRWISQGHMLEFVDGRWQQRSNIELNAPIYYAYDRDDGAVEFRTEKPETQEVPSGSGQ